MSPMSGVDWSGVAAPSSEDLATLAAAARAALPEDIQVASAPLMVQVVEFPTTEMLEGLGILDPFDLTGLYDGVPLTQKSVMDQPERPDTIWLFRRPILDEWAARPGEALGHLVAHILVHEMAHHFGWTDAQIAEIDRWWE